MEKTPTGHPVHFSKEILKKFTDESHNIVSRIDLLEDSWGLHF